MKLFMKSGACSLSPHIALNEAGLKFELVPVDLATKKLRDGSDYLKINPKGQIPALQLDNGELLTEGAVIVQYIADQAPASKLIPAAGSLPRYHLQEWLNMIATEIHKNFSPFFRPGVPDTYKEMALANLNRHFGVADKALQGRNYLTGDTFTVADGYLFNMLTWMPAAKVELSNFPNLKAFFERVKARPAVQKSLTAEEAVK